MSLRLLIRTRDKAFPETVSLTGTSSTLSHNTVKENMTEYHNLHRRASFQLFDDSAGFEFGLLKHFWTAILGLVGLLDILATFLPQHVKTLAATRDELKAKEVEDPFTDNEAYSQLLMNFVGWLDKHDVTLFFIFSVLCFIEAFCTAQEDKRKAFDNEEKRKLFSKEGIETGTKWWKTATFVYYTSVVLQLLVLPVGFYYVVFLSYNYVLHGRLLNFLDLNEDESKLVVTVTDDDDVEYTETYSAKSKVSMLFAVVQYLWHTLSSRTVRAFEKKVEFFIRHAGPKAAMKLMGKAIRNPFKFRKQVKKLLRLVRWVKYLAPLIGACNKLKGNVEDMIKKSRQRREKQKLQRIRKILWKKKSPEEREVAAAICIQSAYRSHRCRRATAALMAVRGDREYFATLRLQRAFRHKLKKARERVAEQRKRLKILVTQNVKKVVPMSDDDKRTMYELQDELGKEAKELLNRKLLLRPNTRFAVIWKLLFVVCVTWEITELAVQPWLNTKGNKGNSPLTVEELVAKTFVPTRVSDRPQCQNLQKTKVPFHKRILQRKTNPEAEEIEEQDLAWYCREPISSLQRGYRDFVALALIPEPVSEWSECQLPKKKRNHADPRPWYCHGAYPSWHERYRAIVDFVTEEFMIWTGTIMFLDVFVTFFTGELDPVTGYLVPKPWFPRWVLPGLILQLAVNPSMSDVSTYVSKLMVEISIVGPLRTLRWLVTVAFPLLYTMGYFFTEYVWLPLVEYENTLVNELVSVSYSLR